MARQSPFRYVEEHEAGRAPRNSAERVLDMLASSFCYHHFVGFEETHFPAGLRAFLGDSQWAEGMLLSGLGLLEHGRCGPLQWRGFKRFLENEGSAFRPWCHTWYDFSTGCQYADCTCSIYAPGRIDEMMYLSIRCDLHVRFVDLKNCDHWEMFDKAYPASLRDYPHDMERLIKVWLHFRGLPPGTSPKVYDYLQESDEEDVGEASGNEVEEDEAEDIVDIGHDGDNASDDE